MQATLAIRTTGPLDMTQVSSGLYLKLDLRRTLGKQI